MNLASPKLPDADNRPIRRAVRRMRWFTDAFSQQVTELAAETGIGYEIDGEKLRSVFLQWVKVFEAQKPADEEQKKNYITFAAGAMLRELINGKPLTAVRLPPGADKSNPAYFWPEGYAYAAFCLNVRSAVIEQDFDVETALAPAFDEIRTWWSFKENAVEDSDSAIAFFDLFAGGDPDWSTPQFFSPQRAEENALRFYSRGTRRITTDAEKAL